MPGIAANVAIVHKGQILLTQREDFEVWCLPSGELEAGESLAQSAVREAWEETGIEVELTRLVGVHSCLGSLGGDLHLALYAARPAGGTLRTQPGETIAVRYFRPDELPADIAIGHERRIVDAVNSAVGVVWQQRLNPPLPDLPRREVYVQRDRSGLSRVEFYRQCLAGRTLVETLEVAGDAAISCPSSPPTLLPSPPPLSPPPLAGGKEWGGEGQGERRGKTSLPVLYTNVAIVQAGRILLLQREDYEVWCMPGGRVEAGESLAQAAVREAREETGLEVRLTGLVGTYSLLGFAGDGHAVVFAAEVTGGTLHPQAGEALDLRTFAPDKVPAALFAGQRQCIQDALGGVRAVSWRQEFVPRLFPDVASRQELYAIRDRSGLPRAEFYHRALENSRFEQVLEVNPAI